MDPNVIWFRVLNEANSFDFDVPFQKRFAYAVHPIHHSAVAGQNDWEARIAFEHQACVLDHLTAGQALIGAACPIRLVEFPNRR